VSSSRKREWKRAFMIGGEVFEKKHPYPKGPTYLLRHGQA